MIFTITNPLLSQIPMEQVHTLLCKKIAQLTKVIYTLNCKAEDRQLDLGILTKTYEAELDAV